MAGENFQDNVELRSDTALHAKGDAVIVGTSPGAKTYIFKNDLGELHLAANPTADRTISLPDAGGTILLSGQAIQGLGVSTGGNTLGSTGTTIGTYVLAGGNQITLSQSTDGASNATVTISARDAVFGAGVSTGGNTVGDTGTRTGTFVLAGGNGITLSQATAAGGATVTISGVTQSVQPGVTAIGVSTGGNTAGTTGTTQGTYVLAGGNQITLSQSTAAGSLATVTISARDAVFGAGVSNVGNTAGDTGTRTGTIVIAGGAGIIASQATGAATNTISIVNSWSTATTVSQVTTANVIGANAGRFALEGHQHAGIAAAGASNVGNTAGDTGTRFGTVVFAGGAGIIVSQATGANTNTVSVVNSWSTATTVSQVTTANIIGANAGRFALEGHQHAGVAAVGASNVGNTAGDTGTRFGTIVLAGGAGIIISQATGANTNTASVVNSWSTATTVSSVASENAIGANAGRFALEGHQHAGLHTISIAGNTSGTTTAGAGSIIFAGGPNITLSCSTAAGGMTISASAQAPGTGAGVQAISAPASSQNGTIVFTGSQGLSVSMNVSTVSIGLNKISFWERELVLNPNAAATNSGAINMSIVHIQIPNPIDATRLDFLGHLVVAGSTAGSSTMRVCVYTRNASSLSSASSTSLVVTWNSGTNSSGGGSIYGGQSGTRWRSIPLATYVFTPGEYWIGFINSVNGPAGTTGSMTIFGASSVSVLNSVGTTRALSDYFADGLFSAATGAPPTSIGLSGLLQSNANALRMPYFRLLGTFA